jgi:colanic acid/amylovoran biosynthesis protein
MRILIEPSDYILRNSNIGDVAMLEVAIARLAKLFPDALIQVLSDFPERFPHYADNVVALDSQGRRIWFTSLALTGRLSHFLPGLWKQKIGRWEQFLRRSVPEWVAAILRFKLRILGRDCRPLDDFLTAVSQADLVVANGMGGITDAFPQYATELLDCLSLGQRWGAVTAMLGQGIGPLDESNLRDRAREVLPRVDFISLREELAGRPLLFALGVTPDRLLTTGDDAIELAYQVRTEHWGNGLGINLRASDYSGVGGSIIDRLRPILQSAAIQYGAPLIAVPISHVPGEEDAHTIHRLIAENAIPGQEEIAATLQIDTPYKVIEQLKQCRVVIVGSYHAAVFALSLGIPAIGLAKSTYYLHKFAGLADCFGTGCQMVRLDDPQWESQLTAEIARSWEGAEWVRPKLWTAAQRQVGLSHLAYQKVYELVIASAIPDRVNKS